MAYLLRYIGVALFLFIIFQNTKIHALDSAWLNGTSPSIGSYGPVQDSRPHPNKPCFKSSYKIRDFNIKSGTSEQSKEVCAVPTDYGSASVTSSDLKIETSKLSGELRGETGARLITIPIPNSPNMIIVGSGTYGSRYYLIKDILGNTDPKSQNDGSLQLWLKTGTQTLSLPTDASKQLELRDAKFSSNGDWMLADSPFFGMTRVNTKTGQGLTFGPPMRYNIGLNPSFITAISNDGNYAVMYEHTYEIFRFYDLSSCEQTPQSCRWIDLMPAVRPNKLWPSTLEFSTNTTIRFMSNGQLHTLTAGGQTESLINYLALGDSFASGEGAYNYKSSSDTKSPFNKCHVSLNAYSYQLMDLFNSSESVACSGAKQKDISSARYISPQSEGKLGASYDDEIYGNFLSGHRPQLRFVERIKPTVVTMSIGGNDIGFGKIITNCIMPGTCYASDQEKSDLAATIHAQRQPLSLLYRQIKEASATGSSIYIVGYPELVDPNGTCALNVRLNKDELKFANQVVASLNTVIKDSAADAGVHYIDVSKALYGYRLCETKSADVAVNGAMLGKDKTASLPLYPTDYQLDIYLSAHESYHPNQKGQRLIADAIRAYMHTKSNPPATSTTPLNSTIIPTKLVIFDDSVRQFVLYKANAFPVIAKGFSPGTTVQITANSFQIGNTVADQTGALRTDILLPQGLPVGLYNLRYSGKNTYGDEISSQRLVYVTDRAIDDKTSCDLFGLSNVDADKDSIDDACDGFIDEPLSVISLAQTSASSYNSTDMKKSLTVVVFGVIAVSQSTASAQSTLQTTSSSLQNQTRQTQNTASLQSQTGSVQQTDTQGVLAENSQRTLGVVSDPKQATPTAIVQPSNTLSTTQTSTEKKKSRGLTIPVFIALFIVFLIAAFTITKDPADARKPRKRKTTLKTEDLKIVEKNDQKITQELEAVKAKIVKKKKQSKKIRKKSRK